jgi:alkylation response protein AidB-like acyl-CoA dehydrogenase
MEIRYSQEEEAFRQEVKEFIKKEFPAEKRWNFGFTTTPAVNSTHGEEWEFIKAMRRKLGAKGWLSLAWPQEYGGKGNLFLQYILMEECLYHNFPGLDNIGMAFFSPTLIKYGTEEQKRAHLPGIARGDTYWCELLSEPDSGSDLASLKTVGVADGDYFRINGQKVWSTGAHLSDWAFILVRTDPALPKNKGLSYFMLDMKTPGITVRPLINMVGEHEFNEVFLDDVRVPKANLVGSLNQGWQITMGTLDYERLSHMVYPGLRGILDGVVANFKANGMKLDEPHKLSLARLLVECEMAKMLHYRALWMMANGKPAAYEVAIDKMYNCELGQRVADFVSLVYGSYGGLVRGSKLAPLNGWPAYYFLDTAAYSIMGGSSEIDRNVIAMRGLGLPNS